MTCWRGTSILRLVKRGFQLKHEIVAGMRRGQDALCLLQCNDDSEIGARLQGRMMTSHIEAARGPDLQIDVRGNPSDLQ